MLDKNVTLNYDPNGKRQSVPESTRVRSGAVIYRGVTLGEHCHIGHNAIIRENNTLGSHCSVGTGAALEPGNLIGSFVRIHGMAFVVRATISHFAFIGPGVRFTDDPHPMCPAYLACKGGASIGAMASIGAGAILLPGVHVGQGALVGAGSVVTDDIPAYSVAVGNPARVVGKVEGLKCQLGIFREPYAWWEPYKHGTDARCPTCGAKDRFYHHVPNDMLACMDCASHWIFTKDGHP